MHLYHEGEPIKELLVFDPKKFKLRPKATLFEDDPKEIWLALSKGKCPTCGNKLYPTKKGDYVCRSVRHKVGRFFTKKTMEKYLKLSPPHQ